MATANFFRLNALGSLSLHRDGESGTPAGVQKRRLGLLAILAAAGKRGLSRDRIQSFIWPEADPARSRHALDQLVYATRRAIDADPFLTEGGDLRLDPAVIKTDIAEFEESIARGELEKAVDLYRGRLLDGVQIADSHELETWIDAEALRLDLACRKALDSLARDAASNNDHVRAAAWRRKLWSLDPLSAPLAISLIEQLLKAGDSPGAIQHGRAYQDLVRRELEVEPDPQIETLIASIAQPARESRRVAPSSTLQRESSSEQPARRSPHSRWWLLGFSIPVILIATLAIAAGRIGPNHDIVRSEARNAYLRGMTAWQDRSKSALDTAVVYFRRAAELDPSYAEAESGLANAYVMIGYSGYRPGDAMFPKAKAAALRAIQLDSTEAPPFAALGMELIWERNFANAAKAFRKAIALDSTYATAHQWYGILLRIAGDIPGSVRETGTAARLDPLSIQIQNNYATFLAGSGQQKEALEHYLKMIEQEPDSGWVQRNPWLLTNMASIYARSGKFDEAMRYARHAVQILPGHPRAHAALANVYRAMGRRDLARKAFDESDRSNPHYPAYMAMFYAAEGQSDSAFVWFDKVEDWGIPVLISLRGLSPLDQDPRYDALLNRLGMNVRLPPIH
jgi:DNA-binding SARP family transcriptional activator